MELLHPFYLDTEMSMAFAAALAGGVALEREEVERDTNESRAVRNLRGNLRLFGTFGPAAASGGISGTRGTEEAETASTEFRLVRQHTEASIFIALYDELRRTGQIVNDPDPASLRPGDIVSIDIGPAVAPLRRVVDQLSRLVNLAAPAKGKGGSGSGPKHAGLGEDPAVQSIRRLLTAITEDLDTSGMVDVVVAQDEGPNVVLTLDKRFVTDQALELLHTSRFTVIGKVTQTWPQAEEFVNTYRRSVVSLVPALVQTVAWQMLGMLGALARSLDPGGAQREAQAAFGLQPEQATQTQGDALPADSDEPQDDDEIRISEEAFAAVNPILQGPAIQILPLAICA
jgi:hypothetical protein